MRPSHRTRSTAQVHVPGVNLRPGAAPDAADEPDGAACGWYASSLALRDGLAVSELSDLPDCEGEGGALALWFATLAAAGSPARH